ncbi:MAG: M1 family metallopeptidase [Mycobacteriales bacterium]
MLLLVTGCVGHAERRTDPHDPRSAVTLQPDLTLVGAGDPLFPELGNGGYDISHYDLDLNWAPVGRTLSGTASVTATAVRDLTSFDLDLSGLVVDRVSVNGKPARFARQRAELVITPGAALPSGSRFEAAVTYHGRPAALPYRGGRSTSALGWQSSPRTTYTTQEPYGAHGWFPCSDHPSDKASYAIHVTAPSGLTVVSNGTRTERTTSGGVTRWGFDEPAPMATYLVTLAIGTYTVTTGSGPHGLPLTFAYFPADAATVVPLLEKSSTMLSYFESRFGGYPFASYGVLVTDVADDETMETQTMVTMGRGLATDTSTTYPKGFGESVLAHELAHQWFGDAVTPVRWTDMWLNEGWAQYAQAMYEADVLGQPLAVKMEQYRLNDQRSRVRLGAPGRPTALTVTGSQVYYGPALMLNGLREQMGDTAFLAMARAWVHDNLGTSRTRADFTGYVQRFAGRDMSAYISDWLDSTHQPAK